MKAELCASGTVWISPETEKDRREMMKFYCDNKTYSGEFRLNFTTPDDKYQDGFGDISMSLTIESED
jgi:hypothetical protein